MIRERSYSRGGGVPPGAIVAETPGFPPLVIEQKATENFRLIRHVYATDDNEIAVEFDADMPAVWTIGTSLTVRVYGADGATHRSHRANNWEGGPFVNLGAAVPGGAGNMEPVPPGFANGGYLGGDPWTITPLDDRTVVLDGSIFKVASTDPDPVFLCGHAYTDEVDAWPSVVAAREYIADKPHSKIKLGAGVFMLLRNGGDLSGLSWPENTGQVLPAHSSVSGEGPNVSIICRGDYFNATPFRTFDGGITHEDYGQIGNAVFNKAATHGWKATDTTETRSINDITYRNLTAWCIPGYVFNNGHPGGKNRLVYDGIKSYGNTNDVADHKGQQDINIDGAIANSIHNFWAISAGMGTVGRNQQLPIVLEADPIGVVNGSGDFTVVLPYRPYVGARITLDANTPAVGNFTFADKGFTIKARGGTGSRTATCNYDGTTLASGSTGSYGGTGRSVLAPLLNKGKPLMDLRSEMWRVSNAFYIDVFGYSSGFRVRAGIGTNNNGRGGFKSTFVNCFAISIAESGDDTDGEAFKGFSVLGGKVQAKNLYVNGNGKGTGLITTQGSDGSNIQAIIEGCRTGAAIQGDNSKFDLDIYGSTEEQVLVDGGQGNVPGVVSNALSITSGSSVATLYWSEAPDTLVTLKHIIITGAETIGGIVNVAGEYAVTKITDGEFTIETGQVATETTTLGGGENIALTALNVDTPSVGNKLRLRSYDAGDKVLSFARVDGFELTDSDWDGNGTPFTYTGSTGGLLYGTNNRGFDCALTYARLMSAADAGRGRKAMVSDSSVTAFWDVVAGGGANVRPVTSDGTDWRVG